MNFFQGFAMVVGVSGYIIAMFMDPGYNEFNQVKAELQDTRLYLHAVCEMANQENIRAYAHRPAATSPSDDPQTYCDFLAKEYDGTTH